MRKNRHARAVEKCSVSWDISVRERGRGIYARSYCSLNECGGGATSWPENPFPRMFVVPSLQFILTLTAISRVNTEKPHLFENQPAPTLTTLKTHLNFFFFLKFSSRRFYFQSCQKLFHCISLRETQNFLSGCCDNVCEIQVELRWILMNV